MSLTEQVAKGNNGRKKSLAKLKIILANPKKSECPLLKEYELSELGNLLRSAIAKSGQEARVFAGANHIAIGLESSLRTINNNDGSSCVLISQNLKPRHLLSLIARNVEVQDETVPMYVYPELEQFVEGIFGIRALAVVFPKDISGFSADIAHWISARRKPKTIPIKEKEKMLSQKTRAKSVTKISSTKGARTQSEVTQKKTVNGPTRSDFMSFANTGSDMDVDRHNLEEDKRSLMASLSGMVQLTTKTPPTDGTNAHSPINVDQNIEEPDEISNDCDDFLQEYDSLVVHKIRPNPNNIIRKKKSKTKRKKSK